MVLGPSTGANFPTGFGGDDFWDSYLGSDGVSAVSASSQNTAKSSGNKTAEKASNKSPTAIVKSKPVPIRSLSPVSKANDASYKIPENVQSEPDLFSDFGIETLKSDGKNVGAKHKNSSGKKSVDVGHAKDSRVVSSSGMPPEKCEPASESSVKPDKTQGKSLATETVATLNLDDSCVSESSMVQVESSSSFADVASASSLFDMSGSSIMQDSQANWGDDVSLSVLVESTTSLPESTLSDNATASRRHDDVAAEQAALIENDDMADGAHTQLIADNNSAEVEDTHDQAGCRSSVTDDSADQPVVETVQTDSVVAETLATNYVEVNSSNTETVPAENQQLIESESVEHVTAVADGDSAAVAVITSDAGVDDPSGSDLALTTSLEKSGSFVMDGSQTSSSVDDLSSSNRTLTIEDFQALESTSSSLDAQQADDAPLTLADHHYEAPTADVIDSVQQPGCDTDIAQASLQHVDNTQQLDDCDVTEARVDEHGDCDVTQARVDEHSEKSDLADQQVINVTARRSIADF